MSTHFSLLVVYTTVLGNSETRNRYASSPVDTKYVLRHRGGDFHWFKKPSNLPSFLQLFKASSNTSSRLTFGQSTLDILLIPERIIPERIIPERTPKNTILKNNMSGYPGARNVEDMGDANYPKTTGNVIGGHKANINNPSGFEYLLIVSSLLTLFSLLYCTSIYF